MRRLAWLLLPLGVRGLVSGGRPLYSGASLARSAAQNNDDDDAAAAAAADWEEAYKERLTQLGGTTGVRAQATASKVRRGVAAAGESVREGGESVKRILDIDKAKESREPAGTVQEEMALLDTTGWYTTLACLGIVVVLAVFQSFRIDPTNYM